MVAPDYSPLFLQLLVGSAILWYTEALARVKSSHFDLSARSSKSMPVSVDDMEAFCQICLAISP